MAQAYLLLNAGLYVVLAAFCTLKPALTSRTIGFVELNSSGRSEYLAVYGGLQLGLAFVYFLVGRDPQYFRLGIVFSLLLYAPIVIYRLISLLVHRPNQPVTIGTAALEIFLLLWAVVIWRKLA